jgi:hypothetical protein
MVVLVKICEHRWLDADGVEHECAEPEGHSGPHRSLELVECPRDDDGAAA